MKKTLSILLLAMLGSIGTASAANNILGGGVGTCAGYLAEPDAAREMRAAWLLGYLSGLNAGAKPDVLARTDFAAIQAALQLYCHDNPLDQIFEAGNAIYAKLSVKARPRGKLER